MVTQNPQLWQAPSWTVLSQGSRGPREVQKPSHHLFPGAGPSQPVERMLLGGILIGRETNYTWINPVFKIPIISNLVPFT